MCRDEEPGMARAMAARLAQDMSSSPGAGIPGSAALDSQPVAMRATVNIGKMELELLRTSNEVSVPDAACHGAATAAMCVQCMVLSPTALWRSLWPCAPFICLC